jgi:hypothetical protein
MTIDEELSALMDRFFRAVTFWTTRRWRDSPGPAARWSTPVR